jgi:hypothetical protein
VRASIDEAIVSGYNLGQWLASLGQPELAATLASASTWCSRAWVSVPWRELGSIRFHYAPIWHRPLGYGTSIVLKARPDASILIRGTRAQERVVLSVGWPDPVVARLDALVLALDTGRVPLRMVTVYPPSGKTDVLAVNQDVLFDGANEVVRPVEALVPAWNDGPLSEIPGRQCWTCDRRDTCRTGTKWMESQVQRVGGIPVGRSNAE